MQGVDIATNVLLVGMSIIWMWCISNIVRGSGAGGYIVSAEVGGRRCLTMHWASEEKLIPGTTVVQILPMPIEDS